MFTSKELRRVRRGRCLAPESLEERMVLSSGQGSTFAIMPGAVTTSGQVSSIPFTINPSLFTPAPKMHGKMLLGIDVTPATASSSTSGTGSTGITLRPEVVSVTSSTGQVIKVDHTQYYPKIAKANHLGHTPTSAVLLTVKVPATGSAPVNYSVQIKGLGHTTGQYLVGFYLPGDAAGTGTVTTTDITTIKSLKNDAATNKNYNFDADVNRDGIINRNDVKLARRISVPRRRLARSFR